MPGCAIAPVLICKPYPTTKKNLWGFPKHRGTVLGIPMIRVVVFWGPYWDSRQYDWQETVGSRQGGLIPVYCSQFLNPSPNDDSDVILFLYRLLRGWVACGVCCCVAEGLKIFIARPQPRFPSHPPQAAFILQNMGSFWLIGCITAPDIQEYQNGP